MAADVRFNHLSFAYEVGNKVLVDIDANIKEGEWIAIMGPNGSGKSTLIRLILGLLHPAQGHVLVGGIEPQKYPHRVQGMIGYMPQKEHVSSKVPVRVKDIVLMGRGARKGALRLLTRKDIGLAKRALESVGMDGEWNRMFSDLSGGQQQRVLFARALAVEPKILILDEPFNGVDVPSQEKMLAVMDNIHREYGVTVIMVVHDVNPVMHYIDRLMLLKRHVVGFGPPDEVLTRDNMLEAYNAVIPVIVCEDGYCHPLIGDTHGH